MDLSAIESKLYKGDYETIGDLDEDFSRMVSNCELYNGENHGKINYHRLYKDLYVCLYRNHMIILFYVLKNFPS